MPSGLIRFLEIDMTDHSYKIGDFVCVRYGCYGQQLARVEGLTKTGRLKVRAYNAGRETWYDSIRTVPCTDILSFWLNPVPELVIRVNAYDADGYPKFDEAGYRVYDVTPLPTL
jgi:hypothetical protein